MKALFTAVAAAGLLGAAVPAAFAAPTLTYLGDDLAAGAQSFAMDGGAFTFSATGDGFNPLAVQTGGTGEVSSFGGFLGFPVTPSSSFTDRGVVTYGPGGPFAAFPATTTVPYSNGANFLGLSASQNGQTYYGFAYTLDTELVGYGFESSPDTAITATTAISAAPEPSSWALMLAGVAMIGAMLRLGRRRTGLAIA